MPKIGIEEQIQNAIARGDFDNLPGAGKPIVFDDDTFLPEELKMSYRVLKNAGMVPKEVELMKEINAMKVRLQVEVSLSFEERHRLQAKIAIKQAEISMACERYR